MARILVIDDDSAMTDLLKIIFELEDFSVEVANSGNEGLEAARGSQPEVIILDLILPGCDGWELCHTLRQVTAAPILVLSALNKPGLVSKALNAGADDFLIKPAPNAILLAHVKNLIRRAHAEHKASISKNGGNGPSPSENTPPALN